ncbi:hypothetical protein HMPREF0322_03101 [Desulfitobacterium hafniense DP7]|uniref:Uncharacterized protein n=1 Tax=Desulfitobacterium hafniense DP7 TaxID=537010 RepID=G9XQ55_DESHA|nr:hypothetical protein HMPREF0322_03101 [Desulfitobacterium hafniense DP7]
MPHENKTRTYPQGNVLVLRKSGKTHLSERGRELRPLRLGAERLCLR